MKRAVRFAGSLVLAATVSAVFSGCVSRQITSTEDRAFDLVNQERVKAGLAPLVMDEAVRRVARAHSGDMAERNFFSHVNPDGLNPFQRLDAAGIDYGWAGENIAWNNFADPAQAAVDGWMASPGHRENILRPQFTRTGMGVAPDGAGGFYFTQVFIGSGAKAGDGATLFCGDPQEAPPPGAEPSAP